MLSARNALIALALILPGAAHAQSTAASDPFAKDVEKKCTDATSDIFRRSQVAVDPKGTESYGIAIVYGRSKEAKGPAAILCVVDRKTSKVEIGSELGPDVVRVRRPKPEGQNADKQEKGNKQGQANNGNAGGQDDDADDDQQ